MSGNKLLRLKEISLVAGWLCRQPDSALFTVFSVRRDQTSRSSEALASHWRAGLLTITQVIGCCNKRTTNVFHALRRSTACSDQSNHPPLRLADIPAPCFHPALLSETREELQPPERQREACSSPVTLRSGTEATQ